MDQDEMGLEVDCSVCGQNAEFRTSQPVQWQAFFDAWNAAHKHTAQEIRAYYAAESADVD